MKKLLILCMIFTGFLFAENGYFENRILFCLQKDLPDLVISERNGLPVTDIGELNLVLDKHKVIRLQKWLTAADDRDIVGETNLSKVYRAHLESKHSWDELQTMIDEFTTVNEVISADLETQHKLAAHTTPYTPSDTRYDEQWYLEKIMADYAWGFWDTATETPGDSTILIGVVDTGVDYEHPELADILYWNLGEDINGDDQITAADENGIDDDSNGFVDDFRGWDFVGATQGVKNPDNDIRPPEAGPYQELSHGSHVSGIAAATSDNSTGIASISFQSKIVATKNTYDDDTTEPGVYDGYDGILYCAKMGAKFINCSWGGLGLTSYERDILDDVSDNYGAIVIAGCGNNDTDNDGLGMAHYPSDYSKCISVAATTTTDGKASYSNYGSAIDISAPAGDGYNSSTSTLSTIHYNAGEYASWPGTSMASPMVAGAFALLNAYFPDAERQWLIDAVLAAADTIDHLNPDYAGELGSGRLNVYRAIAMKLYPSLLIDNWNYTIIDDDGDGQLNPGEQAYLNLTILNELNWTDAEGVTVTLSSTDDGITFPDPNASLGTITNGTSVNTSANDLIFQVEDHANLQAIPITVTLSANQSSSYPYESSEEILITPSMYQAGFPISNLIISTPMAADSLLGDGDKEVITIAENDSLYMFNADGVLASGFPVFLEGETSMAPIVADVDNDNLKEIVTVNRDGFVKIFEMNGSVLLSLNVDETSRGDVAVGNLDSDPDLEIVFGTYSENLHALNINGSEMAGFPINYADRIREGVCLANVTGDAIPEIIFATDEFLHVITTAGTELPNFPLTLAARVNTTPIVAEVDDEYHIIVSTNNETVSRINLDGTIESEYTAAADLNLAPAVCDIDQDDFLEIVFGTNDSLLHAIDFSATSLSNFPIKLDGPINTSPVFADFNNDDTVEIVISTESGGLYILNYMGNHYDNFPASFTGNLDGSPCISDLDGDGDFEVIAGSDVGLLVVDVSGTKDYHTLWHTYLANNFRDGFYLFEPTQSGIEQDDNIPLEFELAQNFPNPFNPSTTIAYQLKQPGQVILSVYSINGQLVRTLVNQHKNAGRYSVTWDGFNDSERLVGSGVYIYKIKTNGFTETRKMVLLR